mmetsp:Transcript_68547/g.108793  ORF Transcript_68547/g.108793 Transcript_68547/m.108793 type:complete len:173 (-) Transcript_68547:181-699(-)
MRREGLYRTARTLRGCCAGRYHLIPKVGEDGTAVERKVPNCCGGGQRSDRCFGHNYSHIARCGQCKPGRRRGAGGAKALKKISCSRSGGLREGWCLVVTEAREAELGIEWSFPDRWLREEGPVRRNGSIAHIEDASPALTVSPVPVLPAAFARGDKKARRGWRSLAAGCTCC